MSVRSAAIPDPSLVISRIRFNFISIPDFCTHLTALFILVFSGGRDEGRALTAISCCLNLRTLAANGVIPVKHRGHHDPVPPWPTTLYLPYLSTLRLDPNLSAPFTSFLISNCSNIEHLAIVNYSRLPATALRPVVLRQQKTALHRFPYLQTLDIIGGSLSLHWFNREIDLEPSHKLVKLYAAIKLDDPLSKLVDAPSSCRLEVAVVPPLVNHQYALNPTFHRPH